MNTENYYKDFYIYACIARSFDEYHKKKQTHLVSSIFYSVEDNFNILKTESQIILFYFILFYFILFYFNLFYFILFYFILFYFILFYFILFYFILFYFVIRFTFDVLILVEF